MNRWLQLIAGIICMVMIANLQYGWTYFVDPIGARFHWSRTEIQVAFTIFVATETWLVPVEGWFVDRYGPRIVVMLGGIVVAHRVDDERVHNVAADAVRRERRIGGRGRGRGVRHVRRQRAQVVRRSARARGRPHRGRLRRGRGGDHRPDRLRRSRTTATSKAFLWFGLGQGRS